MLEPLIIGKVKGHQKTPPSFRLFRLSPEKKPRTDSSASIHKLSQQHGTLP